MQLKIYIAIVAWFFYCVKIKSFFLKVYFFHLFVYRYVHFGQS